MFYEFGDVFIKGYTNILWKKKINLFKILHVFPPLMHLRPTTNAQDYSLLLSQLRFEILDIV